MTGPIGFNPINVSHQTFETNAQHVGIQKQNDNSESVQQDSFSFSAQGGVEKTAQQNATQVGALQQEAKDQVETGSEKGEEAKETPKSSQNQASFNAPAVIYQDDESFYPVVTTSNQPVNGGSKAEDADNVGSDNKAGDVEDPDEAARKDHEEAQKIYEQMAADRAKFLENIAKIWKEANDAILATRQEALKNRTSVFNDWLDAWSNVFMTGHR